METVRESSLHFISPGQLQLFENALGNPDLIQAVTGSNCTVTIVDAQHFPLTELEQWPVFRLSAADIKLNAGAGAYYIYIVVPAPDNTDVTSATVGYSTHRLTLTGHNPQGQLVGRQGFFYYPAGTVSAQQPRPDGNGSPTRSITLDLGCVPPQVNLPGDLNDYDKVFQIDKVDPANPNSWLLTILTKVKSMVAHKVNITGQLIFGSGSSERPVTGVAVQEQAGSPDAVSDSILATTAWAQAQFSALDDRFLRKDQPDATAYLQKFLGGAQFGEFTEPLATRTGAAIDADGNGMFSTLSAKQMRILTLIINKLTALAGDFVMTESGEIEQVQQVSENTYRLTMMRQHDNDTTDLEVDDVLRASLNDLTTHNNTFLGWYRVLSKNTQDNTLTVAMYPPSECQGNVNHAPIQNMIVHRWGNATNKERQRCWYISSPEGRIVYLTGVYKPKLDTSNYASFYGLPVMLDFLKDKGINPDEPYLWVRGLIAQDIIRVDYQGNVEADIVDRGLYDPAVAKGPDPYLCRAKRSTNGRFETHDVWANSCRYRCLKSGTHEVPKWNAVDWVQISGDTSLYIRLEKPNGDAFVGAIDCPIVVHVFRGVEEITSDISDEDIAWSRDTGDPAADLAWPSQHLGEKKRIRLRDVDCPKEVNRFTVTAFVRDGEGVQQVQATETIDN